MVRLREEVMVSVHDRGFRGSQKEVVEGDVESPEGVSARLVGRTVSDGLEERHLDDDFRIRQVRLGGVTGPPADDVPSHLRYDAFDRKRVEGPIKLAEGSAPLTLVPP